MIAIILALAAIGSEAELTKILSSCNRTQPAAIVNCFARKRAEIDTQLEKLFVWEQRYSSPHGDQYAAAQKAWRAWREAQCTAEVAEEAAAHAWGEATGYSECAIRLALQRVHELQRQKHNAKLYEQMTKTKDR